MRESQGPFGISEKFSLVFLQVPVGLSDPAVSVI
jgi:hypothetical protein